MTEFKVKAKIWIEADGRNIIGEGRFELFRKIHELGSLRAAAGELGISYRHAWGQIRKLEDRLGLKLVDHRVGGPGGGGTVLTDTAKTLLACFGSARDDIESYIDDKHGKFEVS